MDCRAFARVMLITTDVLYTRLPIVLGPGRFVSGVINERTRANAPLESVEYIACYRL
jgi:hypothetical protein